MAQKKDIASLYHIIQFSHAAHLQSYQICDTIPVGVEDISWTNMEEE